MRFRYIKEICFEVIDTGDKIDKFIINQLLIYTINKIYIYENGKNYKHALLIIESPAWISIYAIGQMSDSEYGENNCKRRCTIRPSSLGLDSPKRPATVGRKSFYYSSSATVGNKERKKILDRIDEVERLITMSLQEVERNLSECNQLVTEKIIPSLQQYNSNSTNIFSNVNHIKDFFENSSNVNILTESEKNEPRSSNEASSSVVLKQVNARYHQNFTNETIENGPEYVSSISYSEPSDAIKHLITDEQSSGDETEINPKDQSTMKVIGIPKTPVNSAPTTPVSAVHKYVSNMIKKYDSPPWDNPPSLQSTDKASNVVSSNEAEDTNKDISHVEINKSRDYGLENSSTFEEPPELLTEKLAVVTDKNENPASPATIKLRNIEKKYGLEDEDSDGEESPPSLLTEQINGSVTGLEQI